MASNSICGIGVAYQANIGGEYIIVLVGLCLCVCGAGEGDTEMWFIEKVV